MKVVAFIEDTDEQQCKALSSEILKGLMVEELKHVKHVLKDSWHIQLDKQKCGC